MAAKLVAAETAVRVSSDARVYPIFEGTSQIQRLVIARHLLREG